MEFLIYISIIIVDISSDYYTVSLLLLLMKTVLLDTQIIRASYQAL